MMPKDIQFKSFYAKKKQKQITKQKTNGQTKEVALMAFYNEVECITGRIVPWCLQIGLGEGSNQTNIRY